MINYLLLAIFLCIVAGVVALWRRIRVQELARLRLAEPEPVADEGSASAPTPRTEVFVRRHYVIPWLLAVVVFLVLFYLVKLPLVFAITFAVIVGLLATQLEGYRVDRITFRIEEQLADGIDLMVASLQAGAGALASLENGARESRWPFQPQLDELLGRIRFGDDPQTAVRAMEARVPLETFRLFGAALAIHWETGGSLAPTLTTVGRVIRDRIEVNRRIRALSMQAKASTAAILFVTYFIAAVIWRNDPERMRQFLSSTLGQAFVAGAIVMQGIGIVWSSAMSKLKY